jgi:hypothetical protein
MREVTTMLNGIDHAIIAVRDLEGASSHLGHALGLTITPGGRHPRVGTHNSIVRFGIDYLEIIAIRDEQEASAEERGRSIIDFLQKGDGWLGFVLGSDDLESDMESASARGIRFVGPFPGERERPDGTTMRWKTARFPASPYGQRIPFLIQHEASEEERRGWAPREGHPLGAVGIPSVSLAVEDLHSSATGYERLLGRPPDAVEDVPALPARRARFQIGDFQIDLLQPASAEGGLAAYLRERGEGLFLVTLAVRNLEEAVRLLRERGTAVGDPTPRRRAPLLDPSQTLGARFQLVEE